MTPPDKLLLPIATWAGLQLGLLGIGASGIALWAHPPVPKESLALPILLCGQILLLAMLFPMLAMKAWGLVISLLITLPFDELAGLLSNTSQDLIVRCWMCVSLWGVGLGFWRHQPMVRTLAVLFTAGGAVLDYLHWEALLSDGRPNIFVPRSLLPNICLLNWEICWWEASLPLSCSMAMILFRFANTNLRTPLHSTQSKIAG